MKNQKKIILSKIWALFFEPLGKLKILKDMKGLLLFNYNLSLVAKSTEKALLIVFSFEMLLC